MGSKGVEQAIGVQKSSFIFCAQAPCFGNLKVNDISFCHILKEVQESEGGIPIVRRKIRKCVEFKFGILTKEIQALECIDFIFRVGQLAGL